MDIQNKEEGSAPDESLPGPPTLNQSMLDFGYVPLGSQKTLEQIIANTTKWPMIWLADAYESQWLTLEPDHGVLQPGEQQSIRVTAETRSLEIGEHSATLTFSSEGDEKSMSEDTKGKIIVEEPYKSRALRPLDAGLDFGFLTPHSTRQSGLLITNPDDHPIEWRIQIGTEQPGMGVRETLEHSARPAGIKENFSIAKEQGVILSETEGQLQAHASHTVYVTINTANLKPDYAYTTDLALISQAAGTPPTTVLVPLTFYVRSFSPLNDGGPRAPTDLPANINLTILSRKSKGSYTLIFTNDNPTAVDWKLTPDAGPTWLVLSPSLGTFGPKGQAKVSLTAKRAGLGAGNHTTNLNLDLTWNDGRSGETNIKPAIQVVLTVQ